MKIAISGASGFIGVNLTSHFEEKGYSVAKLTRSLFQHESNKKLKEALTGVDIVINLAGAPINHRWSKSYKQTMYDSRIITTRRIVETINSLEHKPKLLISASAVGYYPTEGCCDEYSSVKGSGFLSDLCEQWEQEARKVSPNVRLAITRFGVVIANKGGAFEKMTFLMKFKVATIIGPGKQYFPWICIDDLKMAMEHIINDPSMSDVVNLVTPEQVTNREFAKTVAGGRKCFMAITIPKFFFAILLGEASSFITEGQCVVPQKLLDSEFSFRVPTVIKLVDRLYNK